MVLVLSYDVQAIAERAVTLTMVIGRSHLRI
jgi:hypothetical protein